MNLLEIAGHLGADAQERFTSSGKRVVELRVACRVRHNGKDDTIWWRVSIWDERFDRMLPYLKKGSAVIVVGEMNMPETYVGKDGTTRISMSMKAEMIKFSPFGRTDKPNDGQPQQQSYQSQPQQATQEGRAEAPAMAASATEGSGFTGDDLPF